MITHATAAAVVEGVSHAFAGGVSALADVSLVLEPGTITALIGHNGSGKTTLLRLLAGQMPVQSGEIRTLGESPHPASRRLRARVSFVAQSPELDPEMTVAESLALVGALYGISGAAGRIQRVAAEFGLVENLARRVETLSGGQRQRLHLALGLLHDPELILLDEPTSALDPAGRELVWDELKRRRAGGSAIAVSTHDLAEAARHAQEVVLLLRGRAAAVGSPDDLIAAAEGPGGDLASAYFRLTGEPWELPDPAGPQRGSKRRSTSP